MDATYGDLIQMKFHSLKDNVGHAYLKMAAKVGVVILADIFAEAYGVGADPQLLLFIGVDELVFVGAAIFPQIVATLAEDEAGWWSHTAEKPARKQQLANLDRHSSERVHVKKLSQLCDSGLWSCKFELRVDKAVHLEVRVQNSQR